MGTSAEGAVSRPFPWSGLRKRWRLILALGVTGLLIGLLMLLVLPVKYTSTVSLIVEPSLGNPFAPTDAGQSLDNLTTEVVVAGSTPVAEKVRKDVGSDLSTKQLRNSVNVDRLPNSQVVEMTVTAGSPEKARQIAASFATSYLEYRQEVSTGATQNLLTGLETSAASARADIDLAVRRLAASTPGSREYELAQSRVRSASATLTELETQADQVRFSRAEPGRVLSPASKPRGASGRLVLPAAGLLVGLLVGLAIAVRQALRDDRIFTVEDLDGVGPPVLSPVSPSRLSSSTSTPEDARLLAAAFRGRLGPDRKAVVITAIGPGVDCLQGSLALVDALRADSLDVALVELSGDASVREPALVPAGAIEATPEANGSRPDGAEIGPGETDAPIYKLRGERLDGRQFRELVDRLGDRHELVVIAGQQLTQPATLDAIETVGDTMLVVPLGRYGEDAVKNAVDQVRLFHGRVISLIVG